MSIFATTAVSRIRMEAGIRPAELFTDVGLTASRGEAKSLIKQGGLSVNGERIAGLDRVITIKDIVNPYGALLRVGKKARVHCIVLAEE